ncbi:hypothetical protein Taro_050457, partial [Colocasia esculenta]|nr:hypothetical protein [Colocasia esculenta]
MIGPDLVLRVQKVSLRDVDLGDDPSNKQVRPQWATQGPITSPPLQGWTSRRVVQPRSRSSVDEALSSSTEWHRAAPHACHLGGPTIGWVGVESTDCVSSCKPFSDAWETYGLKTEVEVVEECWNVPIHEPTTASTAEGVEGAAPSTVPGWLRRVTRRRSRVKAQVSVIACWAWGGVGVLVAERWSGVERGGGGQSDVKGPNGFGSSIANACRWCSLFVCGLALADGCRDTSQKATCILSRSGSDRPRCCLVAGLLAYLGLGLLMLNATGRYVAFRSEGDTPSHCDLVATVLVPLLADGLPGGFREVCRACLCLLACLGYKSAVSFACGGYPACSQFAQCLALEGLADQLVFSHCLSRRWFRSHVVVSGMGPQLGQAAMVRVLCSLWRFTGLTLLGRDPPFSSCLLQATAEEERCEAGLPAPDCCFRNVFLGASRGSTGVCGSLTSWRVQGPGCFCLWALSLVEVCGGRVCGETSFSRSCSVSLMVTPVCAFLTLVGPSVSYSRVLLLLLGACATSVVGRFACAAVGFVVGLHVRVGVSRRLREPTCGVAFTGARLWSVEPVEVGFVARAKQLVVNSGEVLPEFFSVGSGGKLFVAVLVRVSLSEAISVLVDVFRCVTSLSACLPLVKVRDLDHVCGPVFDRFAVLFASKFRACAGGTAQAYCVPSSSAFCGLLGVVVLYHGFWCRVVHHGDLCGEACPVFSMRQHRFSSFWLACADIVPVSCGESFLLACVVSATGATVLHLACACDGTVYCAVCPDRACGWRVEEWRCVLLAASGGGLVALVVTKFPSVFPTVSRYTYATLSTKRAHHPT